MDRRSSIYLDRAIVGAAERHSEGSRRQYAACEYMYM